jgi:hypothetical protein
MDDAPIAFLQCPYFRRMIAPYPERVPGGKPNLFLLFGDDDLVYE